MDRQQKLGIAALVAVLLMGGISLLVIASQGSAPATVTPPPTTNVPPPTSTKVCEPGERKSCSSCNTCAVPGSCQQVCNSGGTGFSCEVQERCQGGIFVADISDCSQITMSVVYNGQSYFGRNLSGSWTGSIQGNLGNGANFFCADSSGGNPGPWRLAVYQGSTLVASSSLNKTSGNLNKNITEAPTSTTPYTFECIKVTPDPNNPENWTPAGLRCVGATIRPATTPPPPASVPVSIPVLPRTAIISNEIDRLLAGVALLGIGAALITNRYRALRG